MASYSHHFSLAASFRSLLGTDLHSLDIQPTKNISFTEPTEKLLNHAVARMNQRSISQIHAQVETVAGHHAEIILKLNLPTQPHISIHATAENHTALQVSVDALKRIWPKASADLPQDNTGKSQSIIFDFPAQYSTEGELRILNMQFNKLIKENIGGFKNARISQIDFNSVKPDDAEKLEFLNRQI